MGTSPYQCDLRDDRAADPIIAHNGENYAYLPMPAPSIASADFIAGMAKGMAVLESFDTER